jgi:hypothetical protein
MRYAGYIIDDIGEVRNTYKILVWKILGNSPLERLSVE